MGPKVSRLLVWSMFLSGCAGAVDNTNGGLETAGTGSEAGSGSWTPPPAAGTGGSASGAKAGSGATPSAGSTASTAGRGGSGPSSSAGSAAISGGSGGSGPANAGASGSSGGTGGSTAGSTGSAAGSGGSAVAVPTEKFSFFVTSLEAMRELSGSDDGFGGDLRYGESTGLAGADKICSEIAESSMPGASGKMWRAFLSAKAGGMGGAAVHAKDRIGKGPWYDRTGRLIAMDLTSLLGVRPGGADAAIADNLPNERGEPNRASEDIDNHDTVTGSNEMGEYNGGETCSDWTTTMTPAASGTMQGGGRGGGGRGPMCGHSWPAQSGQSWIRAHNAPGCAPSVSLVQMGGGSGDGIGNSGGYGGIYCFALTP
jgi:hypothetical protein